MSPSNSSASQSQSKRSKLKTRQQKLRGSLAMAQELESRRMMSGTPTTTTLTDSTAASNVGQSVLFTAKVVSASATGTVTFLDGSAIIGTGTLASGTATFTDNALSVATHSITAVYGGNSTYAASTSNAVTETVSAYAVLGPDLIASASGTGSVSYASNSSDTWYISSSSSWIHFYGSGGTVGSGTINFTADDNTSNASRTGYIYAYNPSQGVSDTFNPVQVPAGYVQATPASPLAYIGPVTNSITAASGTGALNIIADGGSYTGTDTPTSNQSWLTIGTVNGTAINYSYTQNGTAAARTATITALGKTFAVTQAVNQPALSSSTSEVSAQAGSGSVGFSEQAVLPWTAVSNSSWLHVTAGSASGSGNATINYTFNDNAAFASRTGILTIGGLTYSLTQDANQISLSQTSISQGAAAGSGSVGLTQIDTSAAWTASTATSWLHLNAGSTSGTGNATIGFTYDALTTGSASRSGTLTIDGQTVTVYQDFSSTVSVTSNTPSVSSGTPVIFTATPAPVSPGTVATTGTVTFMDGSTVLGTSTIGGASAAIDANVNGSFIQSGSTITGNSATLLAGQAYSVTFKTNGNGSGSPTFRVSLVGATTINFAGTYAPLNNGNDSYYTTAATTIPTTGSYYVVFTSVSGSYNSGTTTNVGPAGYVVTAPAGQAQLQATLGLGTHSITAVYSGDGNYFGSTSNPTNQYITSATTTSLTSSSVSVATGQSVTFTASVSPSTATGTVTFKDGTTTLGTGTLSNGVATYSTSTLTKGSHTITAVYGGDTAYATSTSSAVTQQVVGISTASLQPSSGSIAFGNNLTLTAAISPTTATGTVTFMDGTTVLGTGIVGGASAIPSPISGQLVSDGGSANQIADTGINTFLAGQQVAVQFTVTGERSADYTNLDVSLVGPTTIDLGTINPGAGAVVTTTPAVTLATGGNYDVVFTASSGINGDNLGSSLSNVSYQLTAGPGLATFTTSQLSIGTHSFTANYGGDANYAASTSASVNETVTQDATTTTLTTSAASAPFGQAITYTATLLPASATGTVTFMDGTTALGTGTVSAGVATCTTTTLNSGFHTITAVYSGDTNYSTSTSTALTQLVSGNSATALGSSASTINFGQSVTFTATVSPVAVTGSVTFFDGQTTLGISTISNGIATFTADGLTPGNHSITAVYGSDSIYGASTSPVLTETVSTVPSTTVLNPIATSSYGRSVTITASVSAQTGPAAPTGTVTFMDGSTVLGTGILGGASSISSPLSGQLISSGGSATQIADTGNYTFAAGQQVAVQFTLTGASGAFLTSVDVSLVGPTTIDLGTFQPGDGASTITTSAVALTTGGNYDVLFTPNTNQYSGNNLVTSLSDVSYQLTAGPGLATFTSNQLSGGIHPIMAVYSGDTNVASSTSAIVNETVTQDATTTTLTTSAASAPFGQAITYTATLLPASATGTVTFMDGTTALGTGTVSAGVATCTTTTLNSGFHTITAVYSGDTNYSTSTSTALTQLVSGNSATALGSSASTINFGQSVTFTATVSPVAVTGSVTFFDGQTTLGISTISNGIATFTADGLTPGNHSITAVYGSDSIYGASTSPVLTETVSTVPSTTVLNPIATSSYGRSVTITASVSAQTGPAAPTGTVTFMDGSMVLGTGILGGASSISSPLSGQLISSGGSATQIADTGNYTFAAGQQVAVQFTLTGASGAFLTSVDVSLVGPTTIDLGTFQPGDGASTITTSAVALTTGGNYDVLFTPNTNHYSGNNLVTSLSDVSYQLTAGPGLATFTSNQLVAGTHAITAVYGGDTNYAASTSAAASATVTQVATSTTLTSDKASAAGLGQTITFTATLSNVLTTGTVIFMDGSTVLGTGTVSAGVASYATASLGLGSHTISAVYGGDTNFIGSTSPAIIEQVFATSLARVAIFEPSIAGTDADLLTEANPATVWTATSDSTWLQLSTSSGTGTANVIFAVTANTTSAPRVGDITVDGQTVSVTQAPSTYLAAGTQTLASSIGNPISPVVDSSGNVFFLQSGGTTVQEWTAATNQVTTVVTGLGSTSSLAIDNSNNLYIADSANGVIDKWTPSTGTLTAAISGISGLTRVALDSAGNIYYGAASGIYEGNSWIASPVGGSDLTALALNANGDIWYGEASHQILGYAIFSDDGSTAGYISTSYTATGITFDGAGNLFFSDTNGIHEVTTGTSYIQGAIPTVISLNAGGGVTHDATGDFFTLDSAHGVLAKWTPSYVASSAAPVTYMAGTGSLNVLSQITSLTGALAPVSSQPWLTVGSFANGQLGYSFAANTGAARTATITVLGTSITVTQAALPSLGTTALAEGATAGTDTDIIAESFASQTWNAVSNASWLHVTTASGTGSGMAAFTFDANTTAAVRTGTLTLGGQTLTVTQAPAGSVTASQFKTVLSNTQLSSDYPVGVATDAAGNVYFSTYGGKLEEWSPATQTLKTLVSTGLKYPEGVVVDPAGDLFIANDGDQIVSEWSSVTQQLTTVLTAGQLGGNGFPVDMAMDSSGDLFVLSNSATGGGFVHEWSPATQTVTAIVPTGLSGPSGMAIDAAGNLYFADTADSAIKEWSPAQQTLTTIVTPAQIGSFSPYGIKVDGSGNVFYSVTNSAYTASSLMEWSPATQAITTITTSGLLDASGFALDSAGNLYIADYYAGTLSAVDRSILGPASAAPITAGTGALTLLSNNQMLYAPFVPTSSQSWLTIGSVGNGSINYSYTANTGPDRSAVITVLGQSITINQTGTAAITLVTSASQIQAGNSVTFTATVSKNGTGTVTFSDGSAVLGTTAIVNGIATFTTASLTSGTHVITALYNGDANNPATSASLTEKVIGAALGTATMVEGPAAGTDSDIIAEPVASTMWTAVSNASWLHITTASGTGSGLATFTFDANTTALTRTGTLTVGGQTLTVTQAPAGSVTASQFKTVQTYAQIGKDYPYGVATDAAGNVYFTTYYGQLEEWSPATQTLKTLVSSGLKYPGGLVIDSTGDVFIANEYNQVVSEWSPATQQLTTVLTAAQLGGSGYPLDMAMDSAGNLYVVSYYAEGGGYVHEWSPATQTVTALVPTGLSAPYGMAVDAAGNLYFADTSDHAIKEWSPVTQTLTTLVTAAQTGNAKTYGIKVDGSGNVYFSIAASVMEWSPITQAITTIATSGLEDATGIALDSAGNLYIGDDDTGALYAIDKAIVGPAATVAASAGTGALTLLSANQTLAAPFAPTSSQSWLTIGAVGNGSLNYSYTANTTGASRSGVITVLGQSITVTQQAVATSVPVTLTGSASYYLSLDADQQHIDVWNNATGAGAYSQQLMLNQTTSITVTTTTGAGSLTIDESAGNVYPASGIIFNGNGSDLLKIIGTNGTDSLTSSATQETFDGNTLTYSGTTAVIFDPRQGNDSITVAGGTLTLAAPPVGGGIATRTLSSLNISAGATLQMAQAASDKDRALLIVSNLNIASTAGIATGTLDLSNNDLDIVGGNLTSVSSLLNEGYNATGTYWKGTGIISSAAATDPTFLTTLGAISNNDGTGAQLYGSGTNLGRFDGTNPAATDVLVKYTYYGDANLDGQVDGSDYTKIDYGYLSHATGWASGNFNYDGVIDGSDYTLIDNAFNTQGATLSPAAQLASPNASIASVVSNLAGSTSKKQKASQSTISSMTTAVARPSIFSTTVLTDQSFFKQSTDSDILDQLAVAQ